MFDKQISLKQPWLAGILAFLLPGAGHLYQGRYFKAALYFVCILGLFFTGMAMAEWQAVQPPAKQRPANGRGGAMLKYAAQAAVGTPALIGLIQRERLDSPKNDQVTTLAKPLTAPFVGTISYLDEKGNQTGEATGTLTLEPSPGQFGKNSITGKFSGTVNGQPVSFDLADHVQLAPPVDGRKDRPVVAGLIRKQNGRTEEFGQLRGSIPRPFWNWFEVPMDSMEEEDLHRRLGKFHELAMVFTWIAGLLNVLAIWDAVEGPAVGYGDERPAAPAPAPPPTPA